MFCHCGPSISQEAISSCGAARIAIQPFSVTASISSPRAFTWMLPSAQAKAAPITDSSGQGSSEKRGSPAISSTPAKAVIMPTIRRQPSVSPKKNAAMIAAKGVCSWIAIELVAASSSRHAEEHQREMHDAHGDGQRQQPLQHRGFRQADHEHQQHRDQAEAQRHEKDRRE